MKNIAIIPNPTRDLDLGVTRCVITKLNSIGLNCFIEDKYRTLAPEASYYCVLPDCIDLIVVVGGDGSVIQASRYAVSADIPLIGVNAGKVGYLSEIDPTSLDVFDALLSGRYWVKEKMLLTVGNAGNEALYAVNDIVISHSDYLGLCTFRLEDASGNSLVYRSDGIVFATPQGSTAYSLSAGGPVVAHDVETIVVTPVCPHSFFNRSVLFNAGETLTITNIGASDMNISIDGRRYASLAVGECCSVSRATARLKMLTFSNNSMFTELFTKMNLTEGIK